MPQYRLHLTVNSQQLSVISQWCVVLFNPCGVVNDLLRLPRVPVAIAPFTGGYFCNDPDGVFDE
jgi:hypothetical protein